MKTLYNVIEGLLDSDFDVTEDDILPKVGQIIVKYWSNIPKQYGQSHNAGTGWICDYNAWKQAMQDTGVDLNRTHKCRITKNDAHEYLWATGSKANEDVCIICLVGEPNDPISIGIGRPNTLDGIYFTASTGYSNGKWIEQGLLKDSNVSKGTPYLNRKNIYSYIEGIHNSKIKSRFWLLPGHCFDVIKNQIVK